MKTPPKKPHKTRTERGRRLMNIRKRIVASGIRLLDLDEINNRNAP